MNIALDTTPRGTAPALPRKTRIIRGLIIAGVVVLVANLVIFAILESRTGTTSQTNVLPADVTSIDPVPGSTIRPQDTISVDLRDGLTGDLYVDGTVIPVDQTSQIPALGLISFRPGKGKEIEQFTPGRHAAEVRWRDMRAPADTVMGSYSWTFGVG
ncbi:MAG: hypothetical protein ACOYN3_06015 [Acidimicrobiia bacterium]